MVAPNPKKEMVQQGSLFLLNHQVDIQPSTFAEQPPVPTFSAFKSDWDAMQTVVREDTTTKIFNQFQTIASMAKCQRQNRKTTKRYREDADQYSRLSATAYGHFIGIQPAAVYTEWEQSLNQGNQGIYWRISGEAIGLRSFSANRSRVYLNVNNPYHDRISAFCFARVRMNPIAPEVDLLGFAFRQDLQPLLRRADEHIYINLTELLDSPVLQSPSLLCDAYEMGVNAMG